jgi:hypothetical protein
MALLDDILGRRSGRIGPGAFFAIGVSLFALKFALDRTVATLCFGRGWSVLNYLIPNETYTLPSLPPEERTFYLTMIAVALPFVCIGIVATLRRLRDAGLPSSLVGLFFVPAINLLFFAALSVVPTARRRDEDEPAPPLDVLPAEPADVGALPKGVDARSPDNSFFAAFMPRTDTGSAIFAAFAAALLAAATTFLAANVMRDYGWGLFVGMPFFVGMAAAVLHGYRRPRTMGQCVRTALSATVLAAMIMIVVALEGAGCLIMLMPLALPIAALGAACGYAIQARPERGDGEGSVNTLWATSLMLPMMIVGEASLRRDTPAVFAVTTIVEVAAPPEKVWPHVIEFGAITTPPDFIFRAGVAYPLRARIDGRGVGAVRYCEFLTGAFVEPIEVWNEPRLLKFAVTSNPPPMREWSPWKIRPPHLDNFLVSRGGQFELTPLPGGRTRLAGTTWYEHRMWPQAYWRWWSDFLIHRIHTRVLEHVKGLSEHSRMAGARIAKGCHPERVSKKLQLFPSPGTPGEGVRLLGHPLSVLAKDLRDLRRDADASRVPQHDNESSPTIHSAA